MPTWTATGLPSPGAEALLRRPPSARNGGRGSRPGRRPYLLRSGGSRLRAVAGVGGEDRVVLVARELLAGGVEERLVVGEHRLAVKDLCAHLELGHHVVVLVRQVVAVDHVPAM